MSFKPVQWASKSVEGRQIEADGSRLLNFYAVQVPTPGPDKFSPKVPVMLYSSPGLKRWLRVPERDVNAISPAAGVHGLLAMKNPVYGTRLFGLVGQYFFFELRLGSGFEIEADYDPVATDPIVTLSDANIHRFTQEADDSIPAGEPRELVTDGRRIMFVSQNEVYCWDLGKSGGAGFIDVAAPAVADLSTLEDLMDQDWVDSAWVDGYFLLAAKSGQFFHSQLHSVQFDQLDFSEAGTNPDEIVGMEVLNRRIYIIGRDTVEQWFNAGGADFAFERDNNFTLQMGCQAKNTIAKNIYYIIFLGTDNIVYRMNGPNAMRISTESVEYDINRSVSESASGYTYVEEGHRFYSLILEIDGEKKNWTYDFTTNLWHERSETNIICTESFDRKNLVGRNGFQHIFHQSLNFGSVDDDAAGENLVYREAVSPVLFANMQRFTMPSFQVDIPKRSDGLAEDSILIEWSDDNQETWKGGTNMDGTSREIALDTGTRFRVNRMGQSRTGRNIRLSTTAKRRVDVLGAYIETDISPD